MWQLSRSLLFPRLGMSSEVRFLQTTTNTKSGNHGDVWWGPERAAGREMVGYGTRGDYEYSDRLDRWYPAIRFRKDDDIIRPIRIKEKGNWKALTNEEKKLLYRYSFKQTLAELLSSNGYWKPVVGGLMLLWSFILLYHTFLHATVYRKIIPVTLSNEYKEAVLERMIDMHSEPITGVASKWDYEKKQWKG